MPRVHLHAAIAASTLATLAWPAVAFAHPVALARELPSTLEYVDLGIHHILVGVDHLLFLLSVILARAPLRSQLASVSAFTVGHSLSLAASMTGFIAPNPRLIEVSIALSIAIVAAENLRPSAAQAVRRRIILTALFGLLHGCGFASALREVGVPPERSWLSLLGFNGGVELGQVAVMLTVWPCIAFARTSLRLGPRIVPVGSYALLAIGLVWATLRALAFDV